jgi:hypothetical protein
VASLGSDQATATTRPGGSDPQQAALAYARCMRQHGMNVPDPKLDANESMGLVLPEDVNPDDPKFQAAQEACRQYAPNGGQPIKPNPQQQQQQMLAFARCMRQHGVNVPDPSANGLDLRGLNSDSPKVEAAEQACQQHKPYRGNQQTSSGGGR